MTKKLTREKLEEIISDLRNPDLDGDIVDLLEERGYIEPEKEPLTFSQIRKECVSGESVLVKGDGDEIVYTGFTRKGELVAQFEASGVFLKSWERDITNWTIKPKEEKKVIEIDKEVWVNVWNDGAATAYNSLEESNDLGIQEEDDRIACEKFHLKRSIEV